MSKCFLCKTYIPGKRYYDLPSPKSSRGRYSKFKAHQRSMWLKALKLDHNDQNIPNLRLCEDHFANDTVPTIFIVNNKKATSVSGKKIVSNESNEQDESIPISLIESEVSSVQNETSSSINVLPLQVGLCGHLARKQISQDVINCCVNECEINSMHYPKEVFNLLPFNHKLTLCNCISFKDKSNPIEFLTKSLKICAYHYSRNILLHVVENEDFDEDDNKYEKIISELPLDSQINGPQKDPVVVKEEIITEDPLDIEDNLNNKYVYNNNDFKTQIKTEHNLEEDTIIEDEIIKEENPLPFEDDLKIENVDIKNIL